MTEILIAILLAVALDRFAPEHVRPQLWNWYNDWAESIEQRFNGGSRAHGVSAVLLAVGPIVFGVLLAHYLLDQLAWVLGFAFDVLALYLCLDLFRLGTTAQAVSDALEDNDLTQAAERLRQLTGKDTVEKTEVGIEHATVEAGLKLANSWVGDRAAVLRARGGHAAKARRNPCGRASQLMPARRGKALP